MKIFKKEAGSLLAGLMVLGAILRVWLACHDDGMHHPDEIYQGLEPAHRLVFGYGLRAWEFVDGARNWAFPGLIALLLKLGSLTGLPWFDDPEHYLLVVRLAFSAISLASALASYKLARVCGASPFFSACGASLYAVTAPAIFFAPKAIPETASAFLVTMAFVLLLKPAVSRRRRTLGVSLLGLATLFRIQNGLFCAGLLMLLAVSRRWREFTQSLALLVCWAFLFGLVDKITWGGWYHSAITYLRFNLIENRASDFGTQPFAYYAHVMWSALGVGEGVLGGVVLLLLLPLSCLSFFRESGLASFTSGSERRAAGSGLASFTSGSERRAAGSGLPSFTSRSERRAAGSGLMLLTLSFLLLHSAIPHKELRFILPVFPLLGALAGVGLDFVSKGVSHRLALACALIFLGSCLVSGAQFRKLTRGDLDTYDELASLNSAYDRSGPVNRLLFAAYRQPDLCGLQISRTPLEWTGAYSTLHRRVPLYSQARHNPIPGMYNYAIVPLDAAIEGEIISKEDSWALVRIFSGACLPDKGYDFRLPQSGK